MMKVNCLCALFLVSNVGTVSSQVTFPRGAVWIFGNHGMNIYSTDGSMLLKSTPASDICPLDNAGQPSCRSFSEIISDHSKYAWTTSDSRAGTNIEIFDLDNGDLVGAFPTCQGARGFHFLPNRREVWFRCTSPHEGDPDGVSGYWDTFSTTSLSTHFPEISLNLELPHQSDTSYGAPAFIEERALGYSSDYGNNVIHKVDLNERVPLSNISIPLANGGWDMIYNPVNQHLFMKTHVCCTCGGPDKDLDNCVEYRGGVHADPVFVLTGPNANPAETQLGACGRHCDNSKAGTIGVVEVDTQTDSIVGYHKNSIGLGASSVFMSPNGEYIVLISTRNAPANIRLLKPGANGQKSTFFKDIPLPTNSRIGAHAFITSDVIAVPGSGDENELYLVEITSGTVHAIQLDTTATSSTGSSRGRQILYIPGSPYVWISANGPPDDADKFAYVVELNFDAWSQSQVIRQVRGVDVNGMLFVENMKLASDLAHRGKIMDHVQARADEISALEQEVQQLRADLASRPDGSTTNRISVEEDDGSNDSARALGIAALVLGVVAVGLSLAGFVRTSSRATATTNKGDAQQQQTNKNVDVENRSVDDYSMGSKREHYT